jgi:hypothetical protein
MKTFTRSEIEKLPKCLYQPFIPCTCEDLPKNDEPLRKRKCLACCLVGIQEALVLDKVCGAMLCYDATLLVLRDMGTELKL